MAENTRAKMPISQRAKQFSPFAALKGFEEAIIDKEKIFISFPELSEDRLEHLNRAIKEIQKNKKITVTYYDDGEYLVKTGVVTKINFDSRWLYINKSLILFEQIIDIILL